MNRSIPLSEKSLSIRSGAKDGAAILSELRKEIIPVPFLPTQVPSYPHCGKCPGSRKKGGGWGGGGGGAGVKKTSNRANKVSASLVMLFRLSCSMFFAVFSSGFVLALG